MGLPLVLCIVALVLAIVALVMTFMNRPASVPSVLVTIAVVLLATVHVIGTGYIQ